MRVFIGNAPWSVPDYYGVRAGSRWPHLEPEGACYIPFPFFLAYAAALLEENNYRPLLVDGIAERIPDAVFIHKLLKYDPQLILLETSTPSFAVDLEIVRKIRNAIGPEPGLFLCGANHLINQTEFLELHPEVTGILYGEFEFTLLELVRTLESGGEAGRVAGLIVRDSDGHVIRTPARPLIENIDTIPWPSRHQLPMMNYFDEAGGIPQPSVQMWASRGCPFRCIFCVWPQLIYGGREYRVRAPEAVVDEMQWLLETYGFQSVYFDDDTFNIGKERMLKFSNELIRRGIDAPWAIMARADTMDQDILTAMKKAGLYSVKYGVETADQAILDQSGKHLNLDKVRDTVQLTRDLGIQYHLTFTFGLPGETRQTAQKTIELALELDPATVQFSICTPMPGSEYYNLLKEKGHLVKDDYSLFSGFNSAVIRTEELSAEDLENILETAQKTWERHVWDRMSFPRKIHHLLATQGKKILSRF